MGLGLLTFTTPWLLAGLILLPAIWYLLRVTPPRPRLQTFPGFDLIRDLVPKQKVSQRTPWWLLLLRLAIAALIILGFAGPVLNDRFEMQGDGTALVLVDDGLLSIRHWEEQREQMIRFAEQLDRRNMPVHALRLAPDPDGTISHELQTPRQWIETLRAMEPRSWPSDYAKARAVIETDIEDFDKVILFHPGQWQDAQASNDARAIWRDFGTLPDIMTYTPEAVGGQLIITDLKDEVDQLSLDVMHPASREDRIVSVRMNDETGAVLRREEMTLKADLETSSIELEVPLDIRDRLAYVDVGDQIDLLSRWYLSRSNAARIAGLLTRQNDTPLLSEGYYLERALKQFARTHRGDWESLSDKSLSLITIPDETPLSPDVIDDLRRWIQNGGVVVRFAGPRLAEQADDFLPVPLRSGNRELGSALTWAQPLGLSAFSRDSVLRDIPVPEDVIVSRQVLARPGPDLASATWATLDDGTPLITARPDGSGWLVLVHTTANTSWSNLVLSGQFIDILEALLSLSGRTQEQLSEAVVPVQIINAAGRLVAPEGLYDTSEAKPAQLSFATPAGLYGPDPDQPDNVYLVHNAGPHAADHIQAERASLPGAVITGLDGKAVDIGKHLLSLALILWLVDTIISWWLRGLVGRPGLRVAMYLVGCLGLTTSAMAQSGDDTQWTDRTYLAYYRTGFPDIDRTSQAGLSGLGRVLTLRTSVEPGAPVGIDPAIDDLSLFPVIYWPLDERLPFLEPDAAQALQHYMDHGGLLLMDMRDAGSSFGAGTSARQQWLRDQQDLLRLPPLEILPDDHVLRRSFYLLDSEPGRYTGREVWIDAGRQQQNDGVASFILGSHDWAAAWALDDDGYPMLPVVPGGEQQRELAFRFGVNLVMYALTGNYKSDQVHIPVLLDRMQQ